MDNLPAAPWPGWSSRSWGAAYDQLVDPGFIIVPDLLDPARCGGDGRWLGVAVAYDQAVAVLVETPLGRASDGPTVVGAVVE